MSFNFFNSFNLNYTEGDGVGEGEVSVPSVMPILISKNITQNGTYNSSSDNADGYSEVVVNVSDDGGSSEIRGSWTVPKEYLELEQAVINDTLHNELNANRTSSSFVYPVGFVLDDRIREITTYTTSYGNERHYAALKTSDGALYIGSDANNVTHKFAENTKNNWIIIYTVNSSNEGYMASLSVSRLSQISSYTAGVKYIVTGNATQGDALFDTYIGLDSFKLVNNGVYKKANETFYTIAHRALKYIPPISEWCETTTPDNATITRYFNSNDYKYYMLLPDGLDCSNYTSSTAYYGSNDDIFGSHNARAFITLPPTNFTIRRAYLSKENWEYIAEHAPVVSGKTLSMNSSNIEICGGSAGSVITTLVNKGWTVN